MSKKEMEPESAVYKTLLSKWPRDTAAASTSTGRGAKAQASATTAAAMPAAARIQVVFFMLFVDIGK